MISDTINRHSLTSLVTFLLVFFYQNNIGSAQIKDFKLWSNIKLEVKILKKMSVEIEEELRLMDNVTQIDNYFTNVGFSYNFWNNFTFGGYYRFIKKNELDDRYSNIHRYYFDLEYDKSIGRWELTLRTRYQSAYKNLYSSELGYRPENHSRNKFSLAYDIYRSPLKPEIWFELYYQLNNSDGNVIDKMRIAPELSYSINKSSNIKVFFMIEKEYSVKNPETNYILGIGYVYKV
jgi:hypothetical protein